MLKISWEEKMERARKALEKLPAYGPDVDLDKFLLEQAEEEDGASSLEVLPENTKKRALHAGIITSEKGRSGTFFQKDTKVLCARPKQEGIEIMSTTAALRKYEWLKDLMWTAVQPDADKYTAVAALHRTHGYFIRALPGVKTIYPVQACLYISRKNLVQRVHNIIIAEPGSELHIITGCTTEDEFTAAMHIGISEFFVKEGAKITFTMVHSWGKEVHVRPRTGVIVEKDGTYINNYICLREVQTLQMYPSVFLVGENSRASLNSIIYGHGNSKFDVGGRAVLKAEGSRAEIISRVISDDNSEIIARGNLTAEVDNVKGHLECKGLMLSKTSRTLAVPELDAKAADVELSHEAAVGKIAEEQILYLMSRGLSKDEATSLLVRGFLNLKIEGLPEELEKETQRLMELEYETGM
ncbi:MAG: SufD family Fe-S cluster assembly protein [Actinobacteria bacterium]|nr:SufD family Fe-S cluster assembly protein [Actinomycetota bacterium]